MKGFTGIAVVVLVHLFSFYNIILLHQLCPNIQPNIQLDEYRVRK